MQHPILPVILCGGGGTRLAPLSSPECPKQFLDLFQNVPNSLFQRTLSRMPAGPDILPPLVIGNIRHRDLILHQIGNVDATVIFEPVGRNTAPAVAVATGWAGLHAPNSILTVMPSDHVIGDVAAFQENVLLARTIAVDGHIVVFGVEPDRLETGYGFIQPGKKLNSDGPDVFRVETFTEKPDLATAQRYFDEDSKFWNSGIFVFGVATMGAEFKRLVPDLAVGSDKALRNAKPVDPGLVLQHSDYDSLDSISLDYAIMEKTENAIVVPFSSRWRDLGTISSLRSYLASPGATVDPLSRPVLAFLGKDL